MIFRLKFPIQLTFAKNYPNINHFIFKSLLARINFTELTQNQSSSLQNQTQIESIEYNHMTWYTVGYSCVNTRHIVNQNCRCYRDDHKSEQANTILKKLSKQRYVKAFTKQHRYEKKEMYLPADTYLSA